MFAIRNQSLTEVWNERLTSGAQAPRRRPFLARLKSCPSRI